MDEAFLKLQAEIHARLDAGAPEDVREAGRLCAALPQPTPETQARIDHLKMSAGFALEMLGETDRATALYGDLVNGERADPEPRSNACFRYGLIRESQGREAESAAAYELALALSPAPAIARAVRERLAVLMLQDGRFAEAEAHFDALIADAGLSESQLLGYRLRRLHALLRAGRFDPEQQDWRALLPGPRLTLDDSLIGPLAETASELEAAGQHELARDFYLRLLEMRGLSGHTRINCHYRLGLVYESLADWDRSQRHYRTAAEAPAEFPAAQVHARFRLADLLYLSEEYEAALDHFALLRSAREITAEQRMEAQLRTGICLLRLGRLEEARRELELTRERAAGAYGVKSDLCLAELFEMQKDSAAARACYRRVIANPSAEPLTKAAALARLQALR